MLDPTFELLLERNFLAALLGDGEAAVGDVAFGPGEADIHYDRAGRQWHITVRAEGTRRELHPELAAAVTAARALLTDWQREIARPGEYVDMTYYAWRLAQHLGQLLERITP